MDLEGQSYKPGHPSDAVRKDIYLVPEDRAAESMIPNWSISHIATLPFMGDFSVRGIIKKIKEGIRGKELVQDLKVVTTSHEAIVDSFQEEISKKLL